MPVAPTSVVLEFELAGAGMGWTDLSADVQLGVQPIVFEYGIKGGGPLDRVASIGTMTWSMNNSARNSSGLLGRYTPGHANCLTNWELGIAVRLKIVYGGVTYYKFRGSIVSMQPDAGINRRRAVQCVAHDWMDDASLSLVKDTQIQLNNRSDELVDTVVTNCVGRSPAATSYATGQSTFAYAMDNMRDEKTLALRALTDIVLAEVGYLYVKGDSVQGGTLKFEDRHARPLATNAGTFDSTMFDISAARSRENIINHVFVIVHPRKVDAAATTVIYSLADTSSEVPSLLPGETKALTVLFRGDNNRFVRVGADSVVTPVAATDYVGNSQADGGGSNLTSSLGLSFSYSSNSATIVWTNNHASSTIYLTTMQVRGKAVQDRYELGVESTAAASVTKYGERDLTYDMIFEDSTGLAKGVADWIVALYGSARMVVSEIMIKSTRNATLLTQALAREPGDKITLSEGMTGITAVAYFINGVKGTYSAGGLLDVSWVLAPADQQQAWILEDAVAGLLESTTILGFA